MENLLEPQVVFKAQENWRNDPVECSKTFFGSHLWSKQEEVMLAVRDYPKVCVKSGNTVGKSYDVSDIALIFLLSHYPSKVIITAPTFTQVEEIIWKEIAGLYYKSSVPIGGDLLNTELKLNNEWFALGISTNEINRFQGFHSPYLLVIVDEALGIDPQIWEAIEGLHPYRVLAIGNPLQPIGKFFDCFSNPLWHKITISCIECVEWQKRNGRIPGLVTQQWIDERREEWGISSPLYQARVLGEFPQEGTDTLIHLDWVDKCRVAEIEEEDDALKIVASDVARFGDDKTVFIDRRGHTLDSIEIKEKIPTTQTAGIIKKHYQDYEADNLVVDDTGVGCLIKGTEVWTTEGWKQCEVLSQNDILFSKDKEGNLIKNKINSLIKREPTRILSNGKYAFSFSHFLPIKTRPEYNYRLKSWDDIYNKKSIWLDNSFKWQGQDCDFVIDEQTIEMPYGGIKVIRERQKISCIDFIKFLAWFLSEGHIYKNCIGISQSSKSSYNETIIKAIQNCQFNYIRKISKQSEISYNIFHKPLAMWLAKHCYYSENKNAITKKIPQHIKESSINTIRIFLDEFIKGDGFIHKGQNIYCTSSNIMADDILELIYKTGKYGGKRIVSLKGSIGYIQGRKIIRTSNHYRIWENKNCSFTIYPKELSEKIDNVFDIKINSPTRLFMIRFKDNRAFWVHNGGVTDIISEQKIGVIPFNGGSKQKAIDKNHFTNLRSQFYWYVAKKLEKGLYSFKKVSPHLFEKLKNQLCAIKYIIDSSGRIKVESKEDMRARGLPSPDIADTWMMSEYAYYCGRMGEVRAYQYR